MYCGMKTTLTIEDDLAEQIERFCRNGGVSLADVINEALRRGLREMAANDARREPFQTQPIHGPIPRMTVDNVAEVVAAVEREAFK